MTTDPTPTAEQVVRDALEEAAAQWQPNDGAWDAFGAEVIVAALRNSPEALADLNGGEWVQPIDGNGKVPVWFQKFRDAWPEKRKPSEIGRTQPLFYFVPREDR